MTDFAIRIFITNHYLTKPLQNVDCCFNEFTKKTITQVPIIRIFGSTPKGQKVCANIHGVYPYFYVPCFEDESIILNNERLSKFLLNFASSLSSAINLSIETRFSADQSHVFKVTLVKGKPFYGYQEQCQYFLKIYLYNPFYIKKAGDLLLNGAVMNRSLQPYETHIPYNLKFFIDYNLYGMNYLYTDGAMFRINRDFCPEESFIDLDVSDSMDLSQKLWNVDQLPPDCIMDGNLCIKSSVCELEVDICACDILNIQEVQKNIGENPGLKDLWEEEKQRRMELGLDLSELIGEPFEERPFAMPTDSHVALLEEWRDICTLVKEESVLSQDIHEFIDASQSEDNESYMFDLDESVNEDSIKRTLKSGDSFVLEAVDSNKEDLNEDDRDMQEFITACIKMEEEDSIMHHTQSDASSRNVTIEQLTQKYPSFSQAVNTSTGPVVINLANDSSNSDEDLFNQTIVELSDDDESVLMDRESPTINNNVSDDIFDSDSMEMNSDSDIVGVNVMKTHDGADDNDSDDFDTKKVLHPKKKIKLDPSAKIRSPIVTRRRATVVTEERQVIEKKTSKPRQPRKPRISLALKRTNPVTEPSLNSSIVVTIAPITPNTSIIRNPFLSTPVSSTKIGIDNNETSLISTSVIDLSKSINPNQSLSKKEMARQSRRLSLSLKIPLKRWPVDDKKVPISTVETNASVIPQQLVSTGNMFSTPTRSNLAPLNHLFANLSPILKPPERGPVKQRTVSFSIPDVSQESPHSSPQKCLTTQKLNNLEFMKKTVSQSLRDISVNLNCLSQRFQSSMISHLTLMSVELLCHSSSNLKSNPTVDPILMFFYSIYHESDVPHGSSTMFIYEEGVVYIDDSGDLLSSAGIGYSALYCTTAVSNETELLTAIIALVMKFDPDILLGYETTRASWGYVLERAYHTKHRLYNDLGRLQHDERKVTNNNKEYSIDELHCTGRIILDLWVIMKHDLTLTSYSLENVVDDVLKERVPLHTNQQLLAWYRSNFQRHLVVNYWKYRVSANLRLLNKLDIISRTSEFAKIYGIEFYHVLSRGSQYRVEAMMLRLAKPQNLIAISPSVHQRARQKAPECIPLTLEPQSGFYRDPVVVLDFQSLYPSVMIAYNYCFSTSLGKLAHIRNAEIGDSFEFGCGKLNLEASTIRNVGDSVNISPNQVLFVRPQTYKGIISKLVEELLNTRIMVKKSMKIHKDNKALCKLLDSRQLGLKLITNVTFGYTAASYSGRMPCVEVGDSILRKSRETLEEAIELVNSGGPAHCPLSDENGGWEGCKVIYGDTDSMFVLMPGRTKEQAFILGARMADAVTALNPFPVKLKFEKVYLPCLLESKKRYVGYSYESLDQVKPKFDAKGIETVRRDNCNIASKILERTLVRLFTFDKMDSIKRYVTLELDKVISGKVNMIDFIIAKEYRGRRGYQPGSSVPSLHIANELRKKDMRAEPLAGERVPYVIIQGAPGDTLLSCVRQPCELLFNTKILKSYGNNIRSLSEQGCQLSYIYYITKQILPPLNRALCHLGVDVFKWYADMPKRNTHTGGRGLPPVNNNVNRTISSYFISQKCIICDNVIKSGTVLSNRRESLLGAVLCDKCIDKGDGYIYNCGTERLRDIEDTRLSLLTLCHECSHTTIDRSGVGPPCVSTDCPSLFDRVRACQEPTEEWERLVDSDIF